MRTSIQMLTTSTRRFATITTGRRAFAVAAPSIPGYDLPRLPPPPPAAYQTAADDDSLFSYTSGRWLFNEKAQMALRYTPFNVAELKRVVASVCGGASVIEMEKKEGVFNKTFMMTLSNGSKIAARIKNPIAGPAHLTTSSEVATMEFVRLKGVPCPKVLAYSSNAESNSVGAEYIIMEQAQGVQLSDVWGGMSPRERKGVMNSMIEAQQKLVDVKFSHYGGLYFKEDLPHQLRASSLYLDAEAQDAVSDQFCIGPTPNRAFYEDERATLDIDRGPWSNCETYLRSHALREEAWIEQHAKPNMHDDPFREVPGAQAQEDHLRVLREYRAVVPALVPESSKVRESILNHGDLNNGNVFVESVNGEYKVVSIIDWQGCWAGPAYLQMEVPSFMAYEGTVPTGLAFPTLPLDLALMSSEDQMAIKQEHQEKLLHKLYEIKMLYPYRIEDSDERVSCVSSAGRTWKDGVLPLQLSLLNVAFKWQSLSTPEAPCPLTFTRTDVDTLTTQRERYLEWRGFLEHARSVFGMRLFGWVPAEEYSQKRAVLESTRNTLPVALTSQLDALFPHWWPFHDMEAAQA